MLDQYLARALGLQSKRLTPIDEENYVLTPDYTIKMITIHERHECGVPVVIRGETGVGKTALVNMLSHLRSHSQLHLWERKKGIVLDIIHQMFKSLPAGSMDSYQACFLTMQNINEGKEVTEEELVVMIKLFDANSSGTFHSKLREQMLKVADDPARALLYLPQRKKQQGEEREEERGRENFNNFFEKAGQEDTAEVCTLHVA